jgi:hypothetical protein
VAGREALDPEHAPPAVGERVQRGASHHAEADHNDIEMRHVFALYPKSRRCTADLELSLRSIRIVAFGTAGSVRC